MKCRTTGVNIFNAVKNVIEEFNLNFENIFGVTTEMVSEETVFQHYLDKYAKNESE